MDIGDKVKFIDGLYTDEIGANYKVVEVNGDRSFIELICNLPFPPVSLARTFELEVIHCEEGTPKR